MQMAMVVAAVREREVGEGWRTAQNKKKNVKELN